jgi:hypothetical protein
MQRDEVQAVVIVLAIVGLFCWVLAVCEPDCRQCVSKCAPFPVAECNPNGFLYCECDTNGGRNAE